MLSQRSTAAQSGVQAGSHWIRACAARKLDASLACPFGLRGGAAMVGWPGAAQDRLPADALAVQCGCRGAPR
jgi:hypothetical protein